MVIIVFKISVSHALKTTRAAKTRPKLAVGDHDF
jgi:hypothetical protein